MVGAATDVGAVTVEPTDTAKVLGALFDMHLNMAAQVNNTIKTCNYYITWSGRFIKCIGTSPRKHATWPYKHLSYQDWTIVVSSLFGYHSRPTKLTDYKMCTTARPDSGKVGWQVL